MNTRTIVKSLTATAAMGAFLLAAPLSVRAQESHEDAKAQVHAHNHHHHNKAKFIGGGAAGGAAVGVLAGGPVGAVVGGGIGAGGGAIAHKIHRHKQIKHAEKYGTPGTPQ